MSGPAIISGDFATYRHVQGRKTLQLVIEIPAEAAAYVFATLGHPGSGETIPVAVARLDPKAIAKPEPAKERRAFTDLPYAQQAAMRCQDPDFYRFLQSKMRPDEVIPFDPVRDSNAPPAVPALRYILGIGSRRDLDIHEEASKRWAALEAEYYAWLRGMR